MEIWNYPEDESQTGKSENLASYLKKNWASVLEDPNAQRYVSKSSKDPPCLANEDDSSSIQTPEKQNNNNSFKNASENSVHNDKSSKDVKKDTLNSVKKYFIYN